MTLEEQELKVDLTRAIRKWLDRNAERDLLPSLFHHDTIIEEMSDAAFGLYMSVKAHQEYLKQQDLLK